MRIYNDWRQDYTKVYDQYIGHGSFGKVSLVRANDSSRKFYAMKQIDLQQHILKTSLINRAYALDEGAKLSKLNMSHPNIIKYYDSYIHDDDRWISWIMDYCDGGTLRERISLYKQRERCLDEQLVWFWSLQILHGIRYMHSKGVIHRDLKPDNIYIESKRGTCKIGDFGFAKLVNVPAEITNTNNKKTIFSSRGIEDNNNNNINDESKDDVYKLISMSQVGTPSYIAPELRFLIEAHMTFCSVETIAQKTRLCARNIFKGDMFSFGCIIYELVYLRVAFENRFQLPMPQLFAQIQAQIYSNLNSSNPSSKDNDNNDEEMTALSSLTSFSMDLRELMSKLLCESPEERLSARQCFALPNVTNRCEQDLFEAYRRQVTPSLCVNKRQNEFACIKTRLETNLKPIAMKSLKFNQNLIIVMAQDTKNTSTTTTTEATSSSSSSSSFGSSSNFAIEEQSDAPLPPPSSQHKVENTLFLVYNEYGKLLNSFKSFLILSTNANDTNIEQTTKRRRGWFDFTCHDFCVDEQFNHMYVSSRKHGIVRFRIHDANFYFEDLIYDGRLDLTTSNINIIDEQHDGEEEEKQQPRCLALIENESMFNDLVNDTGKRRLIYNDLHTKRLIVVQADLKRGGSYHDNYIHQSDDVFESMLIKCDVNAGLTLDQCYIRQMVSTATELICLFDDLNLINVYNLRTLQLKRTNKSIISKTRPSNSYQKNVFCLCLDSDSYLYTTDGKSIFNLDYTFKQNKKNKKISPSIRKGENLSHTIAWITILTSGKLVLLTDHLQGESSMLYFLRPINSTTTTTKTIKT